MATPEQTVPMSQVQSIIKDLFAQIAPILQDVALTPDKLREALKPYVDPAALAREMRERENNRKQFLENRKITLEIQERCPHKDKNERWAINLQHNFPDHMARGICPLCFILIEPAHWEIKATGEAYIVPEHKLYHIVKFLESQA
jgi:hypothetical protein